MSKSLQQEEFILDFDNDSGSVNIVLNKPLHNVVAVWIQSFFVDTPSTRFIRIRTDGHFGLHSGETAVATSQAAANVSRAIAALYTINGGGTGTTEYHEPRQLLFSRSPVPEVKRLPFEVTDWDGGAVTYNRLVLTGYYEWRDPQAQVPSMAFPDPSGKRQQNAWDQSGYSLA